MTIFNFLSLIGGLALFLFGMNVMGGGLEKMGGGKFESVLEKMTNNRIKGVLLGAGVTAVIQSSSAVTVMAVGFVNSGIMALNQVVGIIMGANIGTCITSWLLSLTGIESSNVFLTMLKPSTFSPILALIGIVLYMFCKSEKKKELGSILLGFSTLMFGMDTMSGAVAGLKDVPGFAELFLLFTNPILGVLVGAMLTGIIQSSSASVGILQALASTGQVSYAAAIPIIMGQNIGTCVTALLSSVGTQKNARRAAVVHLMFNVIGVVVLLAMVVVLMLGYVTLTDVSGSVSSIKRQISDLDEQHVALLTEYEKTFDLATIKAAAEAAGMSKPTSGQIQYIDLSGSDSVTLYKAEGSAGGLLDKAKDGWAYVLEYFR